ncbi:MAG: hydantoinase/oxoprolinase family protein [Gemmataceae bacterium]
MAILGLDIGGANLKAALIDGTARARRFALWKQPNQLGCELAVLTNGLVFDRIALTMTAELCRCFATKREGVRFILDAVRTFGGSKPIEVWGTDGQFHADESIDLLTLAASNWLALAKFAGRFVTSGPSVLVDVGSTTTDVIPLQDGQPVPTGRDDMTRLQTGELIYTGVRRTPLCALLGWRGMAEAFAATTDINLLLGHISECPDDLDTADGRPATKEAAHSRLARMLGGDGELIPLETTLEMARALYARQVGRISESISRHGEVIRIISGSGEFLARDACGCGSPIISLSERLGPGISSAACAYAVAILAHERALCT